MRSLALRASLVAVVLAVACTDNVAPERYGRLVVRIEAAAPVALTLSAPSSAAPAEARPGMHRPDGAAPADGGDLTTAASSPAVPAAPAALDRVQVTVSGQTSRSLDLTLNTQTDRWEGTIDQLDPGQYVVVIKGFVGDEVDSYGTTSGVTVRAGETATATISNWGTFRPAITSLPASPTKLLRFPVTFSSVSGATGYDLQWADNAGFANPLTLADVTQTTVDVGQVPAAGEYHLRVRAKNANVSAGGWSDPQSVVVQVDTLGAGPAAADLGFGAAIAGRRETTNILPAADEDWYRFRACAGDTVAAETFAQRLSPPSDLNTALTLRTVPGDQVVAANDDAAGTTDSRLDEVVLPASGEYAVAVSGVGGTIGAYELELAFIPGDLNTGSACASVDLSYITITPGSAGRDALQDTVHFSAVGYDAQDQPLPQQPTFVWGLSDSSVAAIDAAGVVTALANGTTDVIAAEGGIEGRATLTVAQVVTAVALTPDSALAVSLGEQVQYAGAAVDANGYAVASAALSWSIDDGGIGAVDVTTGLVDALANGTTWVRATDGTFADSAIFAVEQAVDSVAVAQDTTLHALGQTAQLSAEAFDALGTALVTPPAFAWASSDELIASVDGTGLVTAQANGSATVTATAAGVGGTATVAVAQVAAWVEVTPGGQSIFTSGGTAPFSAQSRDSLGSVVAGAAFAWTSLNEAVATVDPASGVATGIANGQAIVQAEADGVQGFGTVTVTMPPSSGVNLLAGQATPSTAGFNLWGLDADDAWAVGHDGVILHWNGVAWTPQVSGTSDSLFAVWGTSSGEVFAGGTNGTILVTYDGGSTWEPMATPVAERIWKLWGAAPDEVFAVGTGGTILRYDGDAWLAMTSGTINDLRSVWGTAANDVYAVGDNSTLLHFDGAQWTPFGGAPAGHYTSIWGVASNDFWIAGSAGLLAHYTGSWATEPPPTGSNIRALAGANWSDIYAAGGNGLVLRYDGATWDSLPVPTTELLWSVWPAPAGDVFVAGDNGVVLRGYRGAQLAFVGEPGTVDPRTDFSVSVQLQDATGAAIAGTTAGTVELALSSNPGEVIHLANGGTPGEFYRIDATTPVVGTAVLGPPTEYMRLWASGYDPTTGLVLVSTAWSGGGWNLVALDPVDGTAALRGPTTEDLVKGIARVGGRLWALGATRNVVWELDPATAAMTPLGIATGTDGGFNGLAVDPTDGTVYAVANPGGPGTQDRTLITIDPGTFAATVVGPLEQWGVSSLAFRQDGTLLATTGTGAPVPEYVWIVDKSDASMRPMLEAPPSGNGLAIAAVPAHLSGTLAVAAGTDGLATFGGLQLDAPASGYGLVARYPRLADAFSSGLDVNVGPAPTAPLFVEITPDGGTITGLNDTLQLTATPYLYAGGTYQVAGGATVTWSTNTPSVAGVSQTGVVTGYAAGVARIDVDEDGGVALSASVDVTVDPLFTGTLSASSAGFADQLTLTPGPGVTWTGAETVTIGGELPYIESQDAAQIVLRVPSVPIGDAWEVVIGNQGAIGFTQFDTIAVTSSYQRPADPGNMAADSLLVLHDTTFFISIADSMWAAPFPPWRYHTRTLLPGQGYHVVADWQTGRPVGASPIDSAFTNWRGGGPFVLSNGGPALEFGVPADSIWRFALFPEDSVGDPQTMVRVTVTVSPTVGTSMVVGSDHSCMLDLGGNAYCWGYNGSGQLGNGDSGLRYSTSPVPVAGGLTFTSLTSGTYHVCGLTEGGAAYCWGADWDGQVGDGVAPVGAPIVSDPDAVMELTPQRPSRPDRNLEAAVEPMRSPAATEDFFPTLVIGGHTFSQIDAGPSHSCGVGTDGEIYCWGYNYYGQLGNGTTTSSLSPVAVVNPGGVTFARVAAGGYHTCALANTGDVYCWGHNFYGQLGDGTGATSLTPVLAGGGWVSIAAGQWHSCALDGVGDVACWGYGGAGAMGDGFYTYQNFSPVPGPTGYGFVRLAAGSQALGACGITANGVTYCWGANYSGQIGDGTRGGSYGTPVVAAGGLPLGAIAMGGGHACGASNTGTPYCWGGWSWGEVGHGGSLPLTPQVVSGSAGFSQPTAGDYFSCALDGNTAYCWGDGGWGNLGTGDYSSQPAPTAVTGALSFQSLSAGRSFACGVTTANAGYCWGDGYFGQLGNGTYTGSSGVPVAVTGASFIQIDAGHYTACGITPTGVALCWGRNEDGLLGTGTVGDSSSVPVPVSTGLTFDAIAVGGHHACALTSSGGDIWCWGWGSSGQLGDGTSTDATTPVQVDNLGGTLVFTSVGAGEFHTCARATNGGTYCWGGGFVGQLGTDDFAGAAVPTLVTGGLSFANVSVGQYHTLGVAAGTGYSWGYNYLGQLGNGDVYDVPAPSPIAGGLTFTDVAAGGHHSCGTTSGQMYCWGNNADGQLGTGSFQEFLSPYPVAGGIVARAPAMPLNEGSTSIAPFRP